MQPRVVYRTHYQIDEPTIVRTVLTHCTSSAQAAYDEIVAEKLVRAIAAAGGRLNAPAARYAVDLCHSLGVLSAHNVWTDRGMLLVAVAPAGSQPGSDLDLLQVEKLAFFSVLMAADGASLLYLLDTLCRSKGLPGPRDDWNTLAAEMFLDIYTRYLEMAGNLADRVRLRQELERIRARPFAGKSGAHKMFIHLQALVRLGLAVRADTGQSRTYVIAEDPRRRPCVLASSVPDLMALERLVADHQWLEHASGTVTPVLQDIDDEFLVGRLMGAYLRVGQLGVDLCPLSTMTALARINAAADGILVTYSQCLERISSLQKEHLRQIRLHVDRWGRPAFVKVDPRLASELGEPWLGA